jgi:hypothetical protein
VGTSEPPDHGLARAEYSFRARRSPPGEEQPSACRGPSERRWGGAPPQLLGLEASAVRRRPEDDQVRLAGITRTPLLEGGVLETFIHNEDSTAI